MKTTGLLLGCRIVLEQAIETHSTIYDKTNFINLLTEITEKYPDLILVYAHLMKEHIE